MTTSSELRALLSKDEDLGTVLLRGDEFELEDVTVRAGGVVRPYPGRKPVITGRNIVCNRNGMKVAGYDSGDFHVLDSDGRVLPVSSTKTLAANGSMHIMAADVGKLDGKSRLVRMKLTDCPAELLGRSKEDLRNCTLKCSYWFLCFNVTGLYSDDRYVYGTVDNDRDYRFLAAYDPRPEIHLEFFNFPVGNNGAYIDNQDRLAGIPDGVGTVRVFYSSRLLILQGERSLTLEGLTFCGSRSPIILSYRDSRHKSIIDCAFRHCGSGIVCDNGVANYESDVQVSGCSFSEMYDNNCIMLEGCDNVTITGNKTYHTGLLNKGLCAISVSGRNFKVSDNDIRAFSYIGIRVGNTRDFGVENISGEIRCNYIDNAENYGNPDACLSDGGGIYVFTHNDDTRVSYNVVCNNGFDNGWQRGIFLDDGAYNVRLTGNLVYHIWEEPVHARLVNGIERSGMNNEFRDNIFVGDCIIFGNPRGLGRKALICGNYIDGVVKTDPDHSTSLDNVSIRTEVCGGKLHIDIRAGIDKKKYPKFILKHFYLTDDFISCTK